MEDPRVRVHAPPRGSGDHVPELAGGADAVRPRGHGLGDGGDRRGERLLRLHHCGGADILPARLRDVYPLRRRRALLLRLRGDAARLRLDRGRLLHGLRGGAVRRQPPLALLLAAEAPALPPDALRRSCGGRSLASLGARRGVGRGEGTGAARSSSCPRRSSVHRALMVGWLYLYRPYIPPRVETYRRRRPMSACRESPQHKSSAA
mmetsp:Transcript_68812/g.192971  ORF Transcript_68812/g.192971 Transcript_68812/m.192971 type:complete len:206 (-) Transcript_68812:30-647(-)